MKSFTYDDDDYDVKASVTLASINNMSHHSLKHSRFQQSGPSIITNFKTLYESHTSIPDEFGDAIEGFDIDNDEHLEAMDLSFAAAAILHVMEASRLARKAAKNSG